MEPGMGHATKMHLILGIWELYQMCSELYVKCRCMHWFEVSVKFSADFIYFRQFPVSFCTLSCRQIMWNVLYSMLNVQFNVQCSMFNSMFNVQCDGHKRLTIQRWFEHRKLAKISPTHIDFHPVQCSAAQFAHKFLCLFAILTVLPFAAGQNGQRQVSLWTPELHFIQKNQR